MGDFLNVGLGGLVALLPNLQSYTEICSCNDQVIQTFTDDCKDRPIAYNLTTFHIFDSNYSCNDNDISSLLVILQTFPNIQHVTLRHSRVTLSDVETLHALNQAKKLETLDLQGNRMFSGGVPHLVDEWLRTCLPMLPKSLKVLDFWKWEPNEITDATAAEMSELGRRIEEKIRIVSPGIERVDCTPREMDDGF
jgi:hypothetical protein